MCHFLAADCGFLYSAVLTCMNKVNLWSFFCLLLMSSSADGWLLQKVPTALFIFSSSSPLNWNQQTNTQHLHQRYLLYFYVFYPEQHKCMDFLYWPQLQRESGLCYMQDTNLYFWFLLFCFSYLFNMDCSQVPCVILWYYLLVDVYCILYFMHIYHVVYMNLIRYVVLFYFSVAFNVWPVIPDGN